MTNKSLSDLWRENRSKDPGTDLASILDGARILAQSLNPNVEVTFAGIKTADTDRKQINLSSGLLGNEYPVSGDTVDVLLGLTVHEVGHTLFSENRAQFTARLERKANIRGRDDRKPFGDLINLFEDIYIDHLMTAYPGYKDYLQRERSWALGKFSPESITKPLEAKCTRADMFNTMIYLALAGGKMPKGISDDNMDILGKITKCATRMCTKKTSKSTAIINAWKIIEGLPTTLTDEDRGFGATALTPSPEDSEQEPSPALDKVKEDTGKECEKQEELDEEAEETEEGGGEGEDKEDVGGEKAGEEDEEEEDDGETVSGIEGGISEEGEDREDIKTQIDTDLDLSSKLDGLVDDNTRLPDDLAKEVSDAIVEKRADLTQLLSYLAKDSRYTIVAYTPGEDAEAAAEARSNTASAEEKLRRVLQDYRLRRTRDYRGLMSGRISSRRLHRAAYGDQRVFQRREKPEEIDMAICLLMDLSGSVYKHIDLIKQITCAICDAFKKEKMEFIALGYSLGYSEESNSNTVNIPRLYDKELGRVKLNLEKEWHMTPSYEGLAAAMAQLLRLTGKKQKILFHFTDGEPNSGGSVIIPELLDDARARGITDIHVCLTRGDILPEQFKQLYGENTMAINDINQLPDVVDQELRRRLKI